MQNFLNTLSKIDVFFTEESLQLRTILRQIVHNINLSLKQDSLCTQIEKLENFDTLKCAKLKGLGRSRIFSNSKKKPDDREFQLCP